MTNLSTQSVSPPQFPLNRTVLFLGEPVNEDGPEVLLLDRFEIPLKEAESKPHIMTRIADSINLRFVGDVIVPDELEILLSEQFAAASEYVYGHPFWESIRKGSKRALYAYLLETRHYLAAACLRMAPSVGHGIGLSPLALLLSKHLLEEWDHAKFFSEALEIIGCDNALTNTARPIPATLEWIHVTRAIAFRNSLSAAVCSGFMEYSSKETHAVRSWHSMLVESGLLPEAANRAIIGHLETDLEFDHSENWRRAIQLHGPVTSANAAEILNDVTTISEMIYRWLSALQRGASASIVYGMQTLTDEQLLTAKPSTNYDVAVFNGLPVWSADLMNLVNWGDATASATSTIVSVLAYAFGQRRLELVATQHSLATLLCRTVETLDSPVQIDLSSASSLANAAKSWLRSVDGHLLWDRMAESSSEGLIVGYILENYHYLASATRHISAAISSCTNASIRLRFIEHLQDELEHCDILRKKLATDGGIINPDFMRPLPTTVAFVGFLEVLASQDWKAYVLVSAFLQASLAECRKDHRNTRFYERVIQNNPNIGPLLTTIWNHDEIDGELGHDSKPLQRLGYLVENEPLAYGSYTLASIAPALAWSFFDGIVRHYAGGRGAVLQRFGWHVC